jgi:hypothetical protein
LHVNSLSAANFSFGVICSIQIIILEEKFFYF